MTTLEQEFYECAAKELAAKRPVLALMAKAFSECDGDERRSGALYIKMRVAQLAAEHEEKVRRREIAAKEKAEKKIREEEQRRKAAREAGETKLLYFGDLCGRCSYFTHTPWLAFDSKAGRCEGFHMRTYMTYSCPDYAAKP